MLAKSPSCPSNSEDKAAAKQWLAGALLANSQLRSDNRDLRELVQEAKDLQRRADRASKKDGRRARSVARVHSQLHADHGAFSRKVEESPARLRAPEPLHGRNKAKTSATWVGKLLKTGSPADLARSFVESALAATVIADEGTGVDEQEAFSSQQDAAAWDDQDHEPRKSGNRKHRPKSALKAWQLPVIAAVATVSEGAAQQAAEPNVKVKADATKAYDGDAGALSHLREASSASPPDLDEGRTSSRNRKPSTSPDTEAEPQLLALKPPSAAPQYLDSQTASVAIASEGSVGAQQAEELAVGALSDGTSDLHSLADSARQASQLFFEEKLEASDSRATDKQDKALNFTPGMKESIRCVVNIGDHTGSVAPSVDSICEEAADDVVWAATRPALEESSAEALVVCGGLVAFDLQTHHFDEKPSSLADDVRFVDAMVAEASALIFKNQSATEVTVQISAEADFAEAAAVQDMLIVELMAPVQSECEETGAPKISASFFQGCSLLL